MSENNEQTCRSCRHYAKDAGECRRQPPKAVKKDAKILAEKMFERQEEAVEIARHNEEKEWKISVLNRSCECALRYALLYACSIAERPENTVITADAIRWGEKFMEWEIRNKFYMTERHYYRTDFERVSESVMGMMRAWHRKKGIRKPMPGWYFKRRTGHLPPNVLNAVVEGLGDQKRLAKVRCNNGYVYTLDIGRPVKK